MSRSVARTEDSLKAGFKQLVLQQGKVIPCITTFPEPLPSIGDVRIGVESSHA